MRYKLVFLIIFSLYSCSSQLKTINLKKPYSGMGFAYIYNDIDFSQNIIKGKMKNNVMQISHQNLKTGTLLKLTNPKNKKSIILKNVKRIKYPDFYKILISNTVANELDLNIDLPLIEITEIKKNKSFIAKKAKIFNEEKKISSKAPVDSVQISNISKNKSLKVKKFTDEIFIHVATFYSLDTARFLKKRIIKEINNYDGKKLKIKKVNNKETQVISGPYTTINSVKNDYITLKNFGFEELDIFINE